MTARIALAWPRVAALAAKDWAELRRMPGALVPPAAMAVAAVLPAFFAALVVPAVSGRPLSELPDFADAAALAGQVLPALAGLEPDARVQALVGYQFLLLILLVPVVGAMAIGAQAIVGEKQARALEPLLATPLTTLELLVAKALTPVVMSIALMWGSFATYVAGFAAFGLPGVWRILVSPRALALVGVLGPLLTLAALQLAVIVSSRASDPRSAQQLGALVILPILAAFVAQLTGVLVLGPAAVAAAAVALVAANAGLARVGVRVFDREAILTRWS